MVTQTTHYETGDAAFAVDRSGVIVLWNSAAEKTFGYSPSTALGQRCWKLLCGQDTYNNTYCYKLCPHREMAFQHEPVNGFQAIFKTGSAGRKQYAISCLTVFDEPGNELLLHICRPEEETREDGHNLAANTPSVNNQHGELTRRELEVLVHLADGKNNSELASVMCISTPTVRNHIQHLLHKLNVHSRLEAVVLARQLGLI